MSLCGDLRRGGVALHQTELAKEVLGPEEAELRGARAAAGKLDRALGSAATAHEEKDLVSQSRSD